MVLSDKAYDVLKWIAQYVLPACSGLYFGLAQLWPAWKLPYPEEITGTIMALDAFLGLMLGLSARNYKAMIEAQNADLNVNKNSPNVMTPIVGPTGIYILMSNKTYDALVWIAQYFLPSVGTFVFAVTDIWHLMSGPAIVGTIALIDTFLGAILGVSTAQYKKAIAPSY